MKKVKLLLMSGILAVLMSFMSFAGEWKQDAIGWWWQNDDGSYPAGRWEWLDGNNDGIAESYCFNGSGYLLTDGITPDGYTVNADGAWIENGVVQVKNVSSVNSEQPAANLQTAPETQASNSQPDVVTLGMKNAVDKAKSYLQYMAFSYSGLVKQLEYEKFTHEEAIYGVDNCGADWNEQAAKKAESYLSFMSFSRERLIEQLEYEGFTHAQAVYGVSQNGY